MPAEGLHRGALSERRPTRCALCGTEIPEGDFNEEMELCLDCIMADNITLNLKSLLIWILIFLAGVFLVTAVATIILSIPLLMEDLYQNIVIIVPSIMVIIFIGGIGLIFFISYKFRIQFSKANHPISNGSQDMEDSSTYQLK